MRTTMESTGLIYDLLTRDMPGISLSRIFYPAQNQKGQPSQGQPTFKVLLPGPRE